MHPLCLSNSRQKICLYDLKIDLCVLWFSYYFLCKLDTLNNLCDFMMPLS